jgi:hypothetical protein
MTFWPRMTWMKALDQRELNFPGFCFSPKHTSCEMAGTKVD